MLAGQRQRLNILAHTRTAHIGLLMKRLQEELCLHQPPTEKTTRGSLLNRPFCPPDDPISQGNDLNIFRTNGPLQKHANKHNIYPILPLPPPSLDFVHRRKGKMLGAFLLTAAACSNQHQTADMSPLQLIGN